MYRKAVFVLALAFTLFPSSASAGGGSYVSTDAERARWTMGDMNSWRIVMAAYRQDHGAYPQVSTLEEVRALVEPKYIARAPMHDAWGTPYRYERTAEGFRVVSAGADRQFDATTWDTAARSKSLAEDAVANEQGRWLARCWDLP